MNHMKTSVLMNNDRLRTERKRHGWTQAKLAEVLGVSTKTVTRWEARQSVPFPYYRNKLTALFGKTVQELGLL
jgi:transcriptional regulator with XRE-family HTH domain